MVLNLGCLTQRQGSPTKRRDLTRWTRYHMAPPISIRAAPCSIQYHDGLHLTAHSQSCGIIPP